MSIKAMFSEMSDLEALVGKIQQYGNTHGDGCKKSEGRS
jgi:hypothetical protein